MTVADVVLFGATGYTGRLAAEAMAARGLAPVLAGRRRDALQRLARALGGLPVRVADVADPRSLHALVRAGDVLVTTVGPFARFGQAALDAALAARAHYLDSTGEPAFIRQVFERAGDRARAAGIAAVPAFGYDYVPGHVAAGAALEHAGPRAVRVDVGYFFTGRGLGISRGTLASLAGAMLEPGVYFDGGRRREGFPGAAWRTFDVDGRARDAVAVPGSECLALPTTYPRLRHVGVWLGWFGPLSRLLSRASRVQAAALGWPGVRPVAGWFAGRLASPGRGPDAAARAASGSHVVAIASDARGRTLATATLRGVNGYDYTARMLAWGAQALRDGRLRAWGALGPIEAFGLEPLIEASREAGLELTVA